MYCTCDLNRSWFQLRHPNQNMSTAVCKHGGSEHQIQSNEPVILGSITSHSCLPNILTHSQNHLHCSSASQLPQQSHSQNVTPWRYYTTCTCKPKCIFCTNSWWPTCPRLTGSQTVANCQPAVASAAVSAINTSTIFQAKENQLNMSNGNCSPTMSESPVPAPPPPQPPQRVCTRCRFAIVDNHNSQPTAPNYGNASNSYAGKYYYIYCCFFRAKSMWLCDNMPSFQWYFNGMRGKMENKQQQKSNIYSCRTTRKIHTKSTNIKINKKKLNNFTLLVVHTIQYIVMLFVFRQWCPLLSRSM